MKSTAIKPVQQPGCLPPEAEGKSYFELTPDEWIQLKRTTRRAFTRRAAAGQIPGLIKSGRHYRIAIKPLAATGG